jgi:uncharacterized membrane protein YbhN (UPF0104 family)
VNANRWLKKRWLTIALRLLILAAVLGAVHHTLVSGLGELGQQHFRFRPGWLVLSGLLYLAALLPCGVFWHRVLRAMGEDARLGETLRAYYIGHLGKYVPGKALVVILRAGLIRSHRVNTVVAAISVFYETLTMMAVGSLLAAAILALQMAKYEIAFMVAVGSMAAVGLPILPPVFRRLIRLMGVTKADPTRIEQVSRIGYRTLLLGVILNVISWVGMALSLWAIERAMGLADAAWPWDQLPLCVACVALATVTGFLSMIPSGLFVRDLVLAQLMYPLVGKSAALVVALVLRLVWLVAEVLISGILYLVGPRPSLAEGPAGLLARAKYASNHRE